MTCTRPGGTLALDLSRRVGWAYGHADSNSPPSFGAWVLPDMSDLGRLSAALDQALCDHIDLLRPARIVCEAKVHTVAAQTSTELMLGLLWRARETAWHHEIPFKTVSVSTVRANVLGTCRFPKGEVKGHVMAWCREQGWNIPYNGDDEADALALLASELGYRAQKIVGRNTA